METSLVKIILLLIQMVQELGTDQKTFLPNQEVHHSIITLHDRKKNESDLQNLDQRWMCLPIPFRVAAHHDLEGIPNHL